MKDKERLKNCEDWRRPRKNNLSAMWDLEQDPGIENGY